MEDLGARRTAERHRWTNEVEKRYTAAAPEEVGWTTNQHRDAETTALHDEMTRALFMLKQLPTQVGHIPEEVESLLKMLIVRRDEATRFIHDTLENLIYDEADDEDE